MISHLTYVPSSIQWRCVVWQNAQLRVCECVVCSEARLQLQAWRSPCLQSARNPSVQHTFDSELVLHRCTSKPFYCCQFCLQPPPPLQLCDPLWSCKSEFKKLGCRQGGGQIKEVRGVLLPGFVYWKFLVCSNTAPSLKVSSLGGQAW